MLIRLREHLVWPLSRCTLQLYNRLRTPYPRRVPFDEWLFLFDDLLPRKLLSKKFLLCVKAVLKFRVCSLQLFLDSFSLEFKYAFEMTNGTSQNYKSELQVRTWKFVIWVSTIRNNSEQFSKKFFSSFCCKLLEKLFAWLSSFFLLSFFWLFLLKFYCSFRSPPDSRGWKACRAAVGLRGTFFRRWSAFSQPFSRFFASALVVSHYSAIAAGMLACRQTACAMNRTMQWLQSNVKRRLAKKPGDQEQVSSNIRINELWTVIFLERRALFGPSGKE